MNAIKRSALPNIVLLYADDWGYGDVSCLNPHSRIPTPHTDALARQGCVFTDAHSCSAVCTPSRYGLLTGRYAWRGRLKEGVLWGYSRELIEPGRLTLPALLQQVGYQTACIGKWHLGLGWQLRNGEPVPLDHPGVEDPGVAFDRPLTAGPHTIGFAYSFILPASLDMAPYVYIENGQVIEAPTRECEESERPAFWRKGAIAPGFQHETCLLEFTRRAEAYVAHAARVANECPFFLYLAFPSPHTPHVPRPPFRGRSRCGPYGDYVVEHDWAIGQILSVLERHGQRERTLVIVTSDNGAHMRGSDFDFEKEYGHRSNGPFRGQKSDAWDGGHRVPFIVAWPGQVPPGTQCDRLVCQTDLLATVAEMVGVELPENAGEDSRSFLPLLKGDFHYTPRSHLVQSSITNRHALRVGRWKFIDGPGSGGWSAPDRKMPPDAPPKQLYDMETDPGETVNRYEQERGRALELEALLESIRRGGGSGSGLAP